MDYTFSGGAKYFDGTGKLSAAAAYSKQETIGYLEYGVTDALTAIVKPSLIAISAATSSVTGSPTSRYLGLGPSEAGAQLHLARIGPAVIAVQGMIRLPGSTSHADAALIGNTSHDAELRGLVGAAVRFGPWAGFLDAEAGYRWRSGSAPGERHVDLTAGARVLPKLVLLVQSFNVFCDGRGTAWFPPASYSKLAAGAAFDLTDRWTLELEVIETVWGRGALRERGVEAAAWYRF